MSNKQQTEQPRRDPKAGALVKLDSVETRLRAARAAGDDNAYGRYYLAWLKLHSVAFLGRISSDKQATPAQTAYLGKLITRHKKPAYLAAKERAGIPAEITILRLSKAQAARLIREMITGVRR